MKGKEGCIRMFFVKENVDWMDRKKEKENVSIDL